MKKTETYCDRCGGKNATPAFQPFNIKGDLTPGRSYDLCKECQVALFKFMQNNDYVGQKKFIFVEGPCPHHVPCAGPCGSDIRIPTGRL